MNMSKQTEVDIGEGNSKDVAGLASNTKPHFVELKKKKINVEVKRTKL